jgi:hypothetical protein
MGTATKQPPRRPNRPAESELGRLIDRLGRMADEQEDLGGRMVALLAELQLHRRRQGGAERTRDYRARLKAGGCTCKPSKCCPSCGR